MIRSMTKFFGLAGVRLGYGVMHPNLRARLKKYQISWSVNAIAQEMGIAALEDINHVQETRRIVQEQRQFLFSELSGSPRYPDFCFGDQLPVIPTNRGSFGNSTPVLYKFNEGWYFDPQL